MGLLTITALMSIDGVVEAPGGEPGYAHTAWVPRFPDRGQFDWKLAEIEAAEVTLLGRVTYESFAGAWPERSGPMADKLNRMPKVVVSTTLQRADWHNTTIISRDVPAAVAALKETVEGEILVQGSRTLIATLKAHDLIDRYRMMVFPIVLGSGFRLFDEVPQAMQMTLTDVQRFDDAAMVMTFDRDRSVPFA